MRRDSKSPRRTKNTTRSEFTTRTIFSTAGSFGQVPGVEKITAESFGSLNVQRLRILFLMLRWFVFLSRLVLRVIASCGTPETETIWRGLHHSGIESAILSRKPDDSEACKSRAAKRVGFKRGCFPIWTCPSFFFSETGRIRFRGVRFQTPNSVSFLGLTEFRGANSVSSS